MVLSLLASGGPNDAPPFFILLTVVFMGIIAIALILAHFRQSLLAGYFICGVILANCGILDHIPNSDVSIQALSRWDLNFPSMNSSTCGKPLWSAEVFRCSSALRLSAWGFITPQAWT